MNRILLHIKVFTHPYPHDVWMQEDGQVENFIKDVTKKWLCEKYTFDHFMYHVETKRVLENDKTWKENRVLPGDHLLLI
ncbi:hypothetical protein [Floccifex sp.]|uniref:hypothetical protein n=1 Tax=Floccifex sp. TaxID=2815810 RepID=UPI003F09DAB6